MGLLKFIKNIFLNKKKEYVDTDKLKNKGIEKNEIDEQKEEKIIINEDLKETTIIKSENKLNDQKELNNSYNKDNYLESDRILKLKYLNNKNNIIEDNIQTVDVENIIENNLQNIWDIIKIKENTQAEHIIKSIPSDKWITMDEIKHNIKLNFNIEYSNDKSLYPYLKTLTDINLIKLNNIGKKRSWKKNIILIKS